MTITNTPEANPQSTLVSKLAGAAVGAGATLACFYNPSLIPYGVCVAASTGAFAAGPAIGVAGTFVFVAANMATNISLTVAASVGASLGAGGAFLTRAFDGSEYASTRIRKFAASGLFTAAILTGGYLVGRTRSDITAVLPQEQGITVHQADGRTTPFTKQTDGTYVLEERLQK